MSTLSTHVLDTQWGRPAAGVPITLEVQEGAERWRELARGTTNSDGRVRDFLPAGQNLQPGTYRMTFQTGEYFRAHATRGFYPYVSVVFEIHTAGEHYHVPLLLSPFGFSTYRGS